MTRPRRSENPSRVANLCRILWNGGVQRTAIAQTEGLRALGCEVDLLFLRRVKDVELPLPSGTRILPGPPRPSALAELQESVTAWFAGHRGDDATLDLDRLWSARGLLRDYSVVVYNDQYAAVVGIWNRLTRGQPYVMMFHEFFPRVSKGPLARVLYAFADLVDAVSILLAPRIVTTSSATQARLDRMVPGRSTLGRLGAPATTAPAALSMRDRRRVFSITVWDAGRHPELYLELARLRPEFHFTLAGIWGDPDALVEFRRRAAEVTNLTVTGPISEATRSQLQTESLIYLRYGFDETGPGLGGLEGLAAGSLVICNRGLGLSEVLENGRNGFVLEKADIQETSALLRRIDRMDATELESISRAAERLSKEQSWGKHCEVLLAAIRSATLTAPGPSPRSGG
jgi:glycosyltransferase involved in cell wall biosynthesis